VLLSLSIAVRLKRNFPIKHSELPRYFTDGVIVRLCLNLRRAMTLSSTVPIVTKTILSVRVSAT